MITALWFTGDRSPQFIPAVFVIVVQVSVVILTHSIFVRVIDETSDGSRHALGLCYGIVSIDWPLFDC